MSDRVLPPSFALLIKRKVVSHVLINLTQSQLLVLCALDGHGYQGRVGVRRSDHLEELLLAGDGQPAQVGATEPGGSREELSLVRAVPGLHVGRAVVPREVRRGVDGRSIKPQVGVGGRGGVVTQTVAGGMGRRPLRVVVKILLVHAVVVAVDGHVQELLGAVVLNGAGLVVGGRLVSKAVHNPPKPESLKQVPSLCLSLRTEATL